MPKADSYTINTQSVTSNIGTPESVPHILPTESSCAMAAFYADPLLNC